MKIDTIYNLVPLKSATKDVAGFNLDSIFATLQEALSKEPVCFMDMWMIYILLQLKWNEGITSYLMLNTLKFVVSHLLTEVIKYK